MPSWYEHGEGWFRSLWYICLWAKTPQPLLREPGWGTSFSNDLCHLSPRSLRQGYSTAVTLPFLLVSQLAFSVLPISVPFQSDSPFVRIVRDALPQYDQNFIHQDDPPPTASRLEFTNYISILTDQLLLDFQTFTENKGLRVYTLLYRLAEVAPNGVMFRLWVTHPHHLRFPIWSWHDS